MRRKGLGRRAFLARSAIAAAALWLPVRPSLVKADDNPVGLGPNASFGGRRLFPDDNPWNADVSQAPVDSRSADILERIGLTAGLHPDFGSEWEGAPNGIPYVVVGGDQPRVSVSFGYDDESDPGPYPISFDSPIEGGPDSDGDRHMLIVDRDNWVLYELSAAYPVDGAGSWVAAAGAIWDLNTNDLRPEGWTSADAAGLPILPGLVRYDEVMEQKAIHHALRFTSSPTRGAYVYPARHAASSETDESLPPMGTRVRLRFDYDLSSFSPAVQVILTALKFHGMLLADNGSSLFVQGAPDPRWDDEELSTLHRVKGRDLEVVEMGPTTEV